MRKRLDYTLETGRQDLRNKLAKHNLDKTLDGSRRSRVADSLLHPQALCRSQAAFRLNQAYAL
jgi:hypothetical protein